MTSVRSSPRRPAAATPSSPAAASGERTVYPRLPHPLPLDNFTLRRLERVEELAGQGRFLGWGRETESRDFFVDVLDEEGEIRRFAGDGLNAALGAALRALSGAAS